MSDWIDVPTKFATPKRARDGAGGLGPANTIERPDGFPPEANFYLRHRRYIVDKRYYGHHPGATTRPPLRGTLADPEDPNCWLLNEVVDLQAENLLFFTRTFGSIPRSWSEIGSTNVALPAFDDGETLAAAKTITACTANTGSARQTLTSTAHGYSANDRIALNLRCYENRRPGLRDFRHHFTGAFTILSVTTDTFDINLATFRSGATNIVVESPATAQKLTGYTKRPIRNRFVPSRTDHDYFLPGISLGILTPEDIPLAQAFTIQRGSTNGDDWPDNTLNASTIPTDAQYWSSIENRTRLILDCTLVPVLGPLIDRRTISYAAQ